MLETEYTFLFFFFFFNSRNSITLYLLHARSDLSRAANYIYKLHLNPKSTLSRNEIFLHAWLNELVSPSSPIPPSLVSTLNHSRDLINEPYYRYFCTRSSLLCLDPWKEFLSRILSNVLCTRSKFFETRDNQIPGGNGYGIGVKWIFRVRFE